MSSRWNSASDRIWLELRERSATWFPPALLLARSRMKSEQRYFLLMAGAGLDAMIVYNIDAKLKALVGKVAYWVGGFGQFGRSLPGI